MYQLRYADKIDLDIFNVARAERGPFPKAAVYMSAASYMQKTTSS